MSFTPEEHAALEQAAAMPDRLKSCPFCGGPAEHTEQNNPIEYLEPNVWHYIKCSSCNQTMPGIFSPGSVELLTRWNTRPLEDALRARLEAAEGLIAAMDEQERLNNVKDTNYSGFLTAFRRQEHKADVTKAREKWEAVK
jgi:hypothetical protein